MCRALVNTWYPGLKDGIVGVEGQVYRVIVVDYLNVQT